MRQRFFLEVAANDQLVAFCPPEVIYHQSLKKIAFGSKSIEVDFRAHPDQKDRIVISKRMQEELQFPNLNIPLHTFIEDQVLFIGPLVGIFTSGFSASQNNPIGERTSFFAKLISVNKTVGAVPFVFGEQHIDWEQGSIKGFFYHESVWETFDVPFPNVIYDRLPNRKSEENPKLIKVKNRLQKEYLIPWYNPGFFNKLDINDRLQQNDIVASYLPETHPFTSFSMIEIMLSQYGHIYFKPKNGSLGFGVHQIIYDKHHGDYYCRYQDPDGINRLRKFSSLEKLFNRVFSKQNLDRMIVQQGIHLLRKGTRAIDFRVHTNKDELGNWHVSAIAAKIAGVGSVTTHKRSGGEIKTISEIFPTEECELFTEKLSKAALNLSSVLDHNIEGIIGEIGFDLGIDRNGDVWFFEANSKPGRSIFEHPELKDFDLLTRQLSIAFAVFLTEQALHHPEELFQ
ncbi:YheC/YheD family protein [Neobacillus massiliamazoniensis]|uniref:Glutathione synthetase ATP-binding domain-like protein n=1 Tax=Neobacillus massiliamazoniensis TaxID=1499688 RepID=A0A0U1NZU6_9BACI|nr:YheC/YheD family protein [Neobacillus massiliamazoniensis]CRK83560.1 glutathione synthetase ATP-binding domain-like protein [Neobacillus massiliamazoniensis]